MNIEQFESGLYAILAVDKQGRSFPLGMSKNGLPMPLVTTNPDVFDCFRADVESAAESEDGHDFYAVHFGAPVSITKIEAKPRHTVPCPSCHRPLESPNPNPPVGASQACPECSAYIVTTEGPGLRLMTADEVLELPAEDLAALTAKRARIRRSQT